MELKLGKGMIISDDVSPNPILGLDSYVKTIIKIIKQSSPKFSIGIYGEWGTGKTTLMRNIEAELKDEGGVLTVWFNAWRYEREDQFALIPLLKTIAYALPAETEYTNLKNSIKKGIGIIRKNFGDIITSVVSDLIRANIGSDTATLARKIREDIVPKLELLGEINEKDTIYFDGIEKIEKELKELQNLRNKQNLDEFRIVVFIDDLDRCSPKKALEVFESVKVFLGVDGFIYVLGVSPETILKA